MPTPNKTRGDALDTILDRTMLRPRDAIMYMNAAIKVADGPRRLTWDQIQGAEDEYSRDRLAALRDEWRDPYLDIDKILAVFKGCPETLDELEMTERLNDIALLPEDPAFRGTVWLSRLTDRIFESSSLEQPWSYLYGPLAAFLYRIGFLGFVSSSDGKVSFHDSPDGDVGHLAVDFPPHSRFVIHPAFRRALGVPIKSSRS